MLREQGTNRIGNIKVHSPYSDSPSLRMGIANVFSFLDFRPPNVSPSAILLIRKINTSIPDELVTNNYHKPGYSAVNSQLKNDWEMTIREQFHDFYRNASRPVNGIVNGNQDAVFFKDQSELLACFCRDLSDDKTEKKWWWKRYFSQSQNINSPSELVAKRLIEESQFIPVIITMLAEWHSAIRFIKRLDSGSCKSITQAMLHEYDLPELEYKLYKVDCQTEEENTSESALQEMNKSLGNITHYYDQVYTVYAEVIDNSESCRKDNLLPPWFDMFDNEIWQQDLSKDQLILLGLARVLENSAVVLRNSNFQKRISDWRFNVSSQSLGVEGLDEKQSIHAEGKPREQNIINVSNNSLKLDAPQDENIENSNHVSELFLNDNISNNSAPKMRGEFLSKKSNKEYEIQSSLESNIYKNHFEAKNTDNLSQENRFNELSSKENMTNDLDKNIDEIKISNHQELEEFKLHTEFSEECKYEHANVTESFSDTYFYTKLGGLLYLISLLKQLNFPDCLYQRFKIDEQISRWATLDAISRALLGKQYFKYSKDSAWKILAGLDRRKRKEIIGKNFKNEINYFMPKEWFNYFKGESAKQFYWAVHNKCLRIWTVDWVVAELLIYGTDSVEKLVLEELRKYSSQISPKFIYCGRFSKAPIANQKRLQSIGIEKNLSKLLSLALPAIHCYLQNILSIQKATPHALLKNLLKSDSKIFVSSSHIDLVADINNSSLAIRRSGLDQDPGWLPEYGRVVLFHFYEGKN